MANAGFMKHRSEQVPRNKEWQIVLFNFTKSTITEKNVSFV